VILSYPLHAPGRPSAVNAPALKAVPQPMLFVEGSNDPVADLTLMTGLVESLGPRAKLMVVEDADHSFAVAGASAAAQAAVYDDIASAVASFAATLAPSHGG